MAFGERVRSSYPVPPQDWESMHGGRVLRKGIELVKIENGGSSLTFSLCRILLKNTTKKVMIMSAILMESHHLNRV